MQNGTRAFDIAGDWKAAVLETRVWAQTIMEGGGHLWPRGRISKKMEQTRSTIVVTVQGSVEPPK